MADQLRAAAQQALEALQHLGGMNCDHSRGICVCEYRRAAESLRSALAQAEPVQRKPLTEEEIINIGKEARAIEGPHFLPVTFARAIERAHGIGKESGDER